MKRRIDEDDVPIVTLWDENFGSMVRYHKSIKEYKRLRTIKQAPRDWIPEIYVLWGPSGVGKSRTARQMFPEAFWKAPGKWWDDYDSEDVIIFDEFRGDYKFGDLLRILDSTPLSVESKGSSVSIQARTIVFTSNFHPSEWYSSYHVRHTWDLSPLNRRIREFGTIIDFTVPKPPPRVLGVSDQLAFPDQPTLDSVDPVDPIRPDEFFFIPSTPLPFDPEDFVLSSYEPFQYGEDIEFDNFLLAEDL